jgi:1-deoxy-D-xylulose-5-phosphate synthase
MLSEIQNPRDIQNFSIAELEKLSQEIRERIISVLSKNGGHLSSNLGAVELTIALHYVFNAPIDKFLFDVSHQTYTHKLLTGRNPQFDKIRQYQGLCGFSHPKESPYDHFYAGHAGTALSLALGMAKDRDLFEREEYIVPIIGDATLTCGMVLEALNNLPKDLKRFIVVLNDNAMSISQNVGAISMILGRIMSNPFIHKFYPEQEEKQKSFSCPSSFFEQYGLTYVGPIEGHDIKKLVAKLTSLKKMHGPFLLHVLTTKGKGMPEAMKNPISHHGARPFNMDSGKFLPNPSVKPTFPKVFGKHLLEMAQSDPHLIAVTPAMSYGSCLDGFKEAFPDRCIDVGIAEAHSVTYCAGIAKAGQLKVVSSIYATFLQRALDNLFHDVCLQEIPIVFAVDRAGLSGADGPTHHGIYDISFLRSMPNMVICQPRNGRILKELMLEAFDWKKPTAIRYPNMITEEDGPPQVKRPLGQGEVIASGEGLLIIALGHMNEEALQVHQELQKKGISSTVFDPIFVKPLDEVQLETLFQTHRYVLTLEEHSLPGGLGAAINQFIMKKKILVDGVLNKGIPDQYMQQGSRRELLLEVGLTPMQLVEEIESSFALKTQEIVSL